MNELIEFSLDTENQEKNYNLALWYDQQGHTAPAHTYYLRAAERTEDKLLSYTALIRASFCYKKQGSRDSTEKILLENALNLLPQNPEAYYFLSLLYERNGDWRNCYTYANLGLHCYQKEITPINISEYTGQELLLFQKAVSSWHWGKGDESRELFQLLFNEYYNIMDEKHQKLIDENMNRFGLKTKNVERTDIINLLIKKINAKKYLEIGVAEGENLAKINCNCKIGVDPNLNSPASIHLTSDEFFKLNTETFDVIFIDGLHHADQVLKDILNALDILNENGYIICHDMSPEKEEYQIIPVEDSGGVLDGTGTWNGDCWKAFIELRKERNDLEMFVVNTDHGCGIIKKGKQTLIKIDGEITYKNFDIHRKEWLNLIQVEDFLELLIKKNKIPVIGVPIVNGVHWLKRLIESIDYPVEELFIVNNNGRDQITDELDELIKINHPFVDKIRVCHLPHNLGVSGAWNLIIKSYIMSPYWIICNNDVAFTPGFLEEMVNKSSSSETEIVWIRPAGLTAGSINEHYVPHGLGSFECFLLKDTVVEKCGLFDENLYPAYCEDCDYLIKIKFNNISSEYVYTPYYHGKSQNYATGSQTLKIENAEISNKIHEAHMMNIQYINDKWGSNWENWGDYSNRILMGDKLYDLNFNRKKYLGF